MEYSQIKEVLDENREIEIGDFFFSKDNYDVYWFSDNGDDYLYSCEFEELMEMVEMYIRREFVEWDAITILDSFENCDENY